MRPDQGLLAAPPMLRALAPGARFDLGWHRQLRPTASDEQRAASDLRQPAALSLSCRFGAR